MKHLEVSGAVRHIYIYIYIYVYIECVFFPFISRFTGTI